LGEIFLEVSYLHGTNLSPTAYKNIYAVWIENSGFDFIQNIRICKKLIAGGITGIALPFWKINRYPLSESGEVSLLNDVITGATVANADFTVSAKLKDLNVRKFTIYFETDRSYEPNDWFADQPALLYSAEIDLDSTVVEYELLPYGWTPNVNIIINTDTFITGVLQSELRFITNFKTETGFGEIDNTRQATNMVKKLTVKVIK